MKDDMVSLIEDIGEFTLDSFMPDGIMRDVPIVGPVFSMIKIGKDIRDRIFLEKLKSFIVIIPWLFEPPVRTLRAAIPENKSHIFR